MYICVGINGFKMFFCYLLESFSIKQNLDEMRTFGNLLTLIFTYGIVANVEAHLKCFDLTSLDKPIVGTSTALPNEGPEHEEFIEKISKFVSDVDEILSIERTQDGEVQYFTSNFPESPEEVEAVLVSILELQSRYENLVQELKAKNLVKVETSSSAGLIKRLINVNCTLKFLLIPKCQQAYQTF
jgi:hypothetical protein